MQVLYEDNHLLLVDKPAGVPVQPDASGDTSLDIMAKGYLREKYNKPGRVYLGLVHRLDRPTSGIVVLAKTDKAAGRMAELFRSRNIVKLYYALVDCAAMPKSDETITDVLTPLPNGGMQIHRNGTAKPGASGDAKKRTAELSYTRLAVAKDGSRALLLVNLRSGVKHQIRCQLAARGFPVMGDFRYGPFSRPAKPVRVCEGRAVLLHAACVEFVHPVKKEPLVVAAPLPEYWRSFAEGVFDWPLPPPENSLQDRR